VFNTFLYPVLCAVIQGITEAFPVSSSFHFTVLSTWMQGAPEPSKSLSVVLHTGSFLALCLIFRQDILCMIQGFFGFCKTRLFLKHNPTQGAAQKEARHFFYTIALSILGLLCGIAVVYSIKKVFFPNFVFSLSMMAGLSLVFALFLEGVNRWQHNRFDRDARSFSFQGALWIGMSQVLAMVCSGISRLGITLTVGRMLGYSLYSSTRYSLVMGIPVLGFGIVFSLPDLAETLLANPQAWLYMTGLTFLCSWPMVHAMLWLAKRESTLLFTVYRVVLACVVLWIQLKDVAPTVVAPL